ncbi:hypothetical protein BDF19DRAFT_432195 [Syncephalis fuscata]|nr:hypothetical protein BDF19DRAFT_432195 [Syncephalis fuscata]
MNRLGIQARGYAVKLSASAAAAAAAAAAATKAKKSIDASLGGDPRNQLLKRMLFETPVRQPTITAEIEERQQVIERAWLQEQERYEAQHRQALERQREHIIEAHNELKQTSMYLYQGATNFEHGLVFPRQMRAPTNTPATTGWNYSFKAPTPKSSSST